MEDSGSYVHEGVVTSYDDNGTVGGDGSTAADSRIKAFFEYNRQVIAEEVANIYSAGLYRRTETMKIL